MAGKIAAPVFVNGPDDNVLVGDTVQVTTPAEQDKTVAPEAKVDSEQVVQKLVVQPAAPAEEGTSWFSPSAIASAVDEIPKGDRDAAVDLTKRLVDGGKLDIADVKTVDSLFEKTGLEERMKSISSNFNLDDYSLDLKVDMLENIDWDMDLDFGSMGNMFDGLSDIWPDVDMGEWTDGLGLEMFEDLSFKESLFGDADWIDTDFLDGIDMSKWTDKGVDYLKKMTKDIKSEKHMDWLMKLTEKLSPALMEAINPRMVREILRVYPWGFRASHRKGGEEAYSALISKLASIDNDWWLIERNGVMVNDLAPYYIASHDARQVLSRHDPHQTNVILSETYKLTDLSETINGKGPTKEVIEIKPRVVEKTTEVISSSVTIPYKAPKDKSPYDEIMADGVVTEDEMERYRAWNLGTA